MPINKSLWSLSFALAMSGLAFFVLGIFYYTIDVRRWWSGAPFRWVGLNSILIYLVSEVMHDYFPLSWEYSRPKTHGDQMFMNLTAVFFLTLLAYYCFKINFFIRI